MWGYSLELQVCRALIWVGREAGLRLERLRDWGRQGLELELELQEQGQQEEEQTLEPRDGLRLPSSAGSEQPCRHIPTPIKDVADESGHSSTVSLPPSCLAKCKS